MSLVPWSKYTKKIMAPRAVSAIYVTLRTQLEPQNKDLRTNSNYFFIVVEKPSFKVVFLLHILVLVICGYGCYFSP